MSKPDGNFNIVKKEKEMTITQFQSKVTKLEGKKSSISIGNAREIIKLINKEISAISKEDLESIVKSSKGQNCSNLLYKIVKKL